jgi:hypothetical protein
MINHQASAQMLGYLYQLHCGLYLLLSDDNEKVSLCFEKFDDIVVANDEDKLSMYQVKLHTKQFGDLSDSSTDLWRTLNLWIDWAKANLEQILDTKFSIITNAKAPQSSAANMLRIDSRNVELAYTILKNVSNASKNKSHQQYYEKFLSLSEDKAKQLLYNIVVVDSNGDIQSVDEKIKNILKYSINFRYIDNLFERLVGWWLKRSEEVLMSNQPNFISQREVQSKIVQIASEYQEDNLPIDDFDDSTIDKTDCNNVQVFQKQLNLLSVGERRLRIATKDYYRAFSHRNKWVNDELAYIDELDRYESKLSDEWEHCFSIMEDELEAIDNPTEEEKKTRGIKLLNEIEHKDIRIREKVSEPFVMRGSYHILSNQLKIGWHIDYQARLE